MSKARLVGKDGCKDVYLWAPIHEVESAALTQLKKTASLPWVFHHVAAMPDVHLGVGATVGSVIAMKDAVAPAAVGVDIGCGMGAIKTSLKASDLPDNLEGLRSAIEAAIPVGFHEHDRPAFKSRMPDDIQRDGATLFSEFRGLTQEVQDSLGKAKRQVGTLGGGNHFVEVCLDKGGQVQCAGHTDLKSFAACSGWHYEEPHVWLMLHSGSRNIGKVLAEIHIARARKLAHNQALPDRDLAVFLANTPEMQAYRNDLFWAQRYAFLNRRVMFALLKEVIDLNFVHESDPITYDEPILCHHNYVSEENHFGEDVFLTRKGAISAKRGEWGIIPGSMGTKSYIVRGLGNPDSFQSASHGAGRRMSRSEAKRRFTVSDLETQTLGVCCRKDQGVVDEIPSAYKDIDQVMSNQSDLVEIVTELKQVLCVKG
jgi:tRNA-splicing ligase RtcB